MFHGYQGDLINDQLWKISRWLVRYLWKPLEIRGVKDPTSAAKNYTKIRRIEESFIRYSCSKHCILIAGHTHKPSLMRTECGMYFNSGSCIHPEAVTAIELQADKAILVKWSICSREDMGTLRLPGDPGAGSPLTAENDGAAAEKYRNGLPSAG